MKIYVLVKKDAKILEECLSINFTVLLNEEKIETIKRNFAPWQRLVLKNCLNEFIEVRIFFETRNDFFSPPVKRNFRLKRIVLQPKEEIILLFPINRWGIEEKYGVKGRFFIYSRSFQRTASGIFCSGEIRKKLDLSYRHYRKMSVKVKDKDIKFKGNKIEFKKYNMYPRRKYRRNFSPFLIKFGRRW